MDRVTLSRAKKYTDMRLNNVSPANVTFISNTKNLFDKTTITTGKYLSFNNGTLSANTAFFASDFIAVKPSTNYTFSIATNNARYVCYTKDKAYIKGEQKVTQFVTTADTAYIRVSGKLAEINTVQVEEGTTQTTYVEHSLPTFQGVKIKRTDILDNCKVLQGKRIVFFGDSYTYNANGYHKILADRTGCTNIKQALSGSNMTVDLCTQSSGNISGFITRFPTLVTEVDNINGLLLFGGINDAISIGAGRIALGSMQDEDNYNSFYGKLKHLCEMIMTQYYSKKLMAVLPNDCQVVENDIGTTYINTHIQSVREAQEKIYNWYGIPFVDLKKECHEMGTASYLISKYRISTTDIHPNSDGHKAIADTIEPKFIQIFKQS